MCSIYGVIYRKNCSRKFLEEKMNVMFQKTIHRGSDENEIKYFERGAIGMNRLSIIGPYDKNAMVQNGKNIYSIFNGEITNYKELQCEIQKNIQCDSEVILPMFEKYGESFVKKLGGMFSIAIYNNVENILYLWRDAMRNKTFILLFK